jgi:hypothetical protein
MHQVIRNTGRSQAHQSTAICGILAVGLFLGLAIGSPHANAQTPDNGIVVGQPKLYDERSLESLLGAVQNGLIGQNGSGTNYVNANTVASHEGYLQGGSSDTSTLTGNINEVAAVPHPVSSTASASTSSSSTTPPAASTTSTVAPTTTAGSPGSPPIWQTGASSAGIAAPLSIASEDTLQQQVGLSFEATNLALLLQHSVSDRLIFQQGKAIPRELAVLGFQISVEPSNQDKNSVAVADITVTDPNGVSETPQVVMMLPQDKTYNVARVTSDTKSFSLGAFAAPFVGSVGSNNSKGGAYVVYDVDTVALQRPENPGSHSVTFSWEFRPVLGEQAVQPGTRQVYVLLSLPVAAELAPGDESQSSLPFIPKISVSTYWRKLDTKSKTIDTGSQVDRSIYDLDALPIYDMDTYENGLEPIIENVDWHDSGNNSLFVEAEGENFTPPVSIVVDGQSAGAVQECGGRLLSFNSSLTALRYEDPVVIGPYGLPVELDQPELKDNAGANIEPKDIGEGIRINNIQVSRLDENDSLLKLQLVAKKYSAADTSFVPKLPANAQLVISIGSQVYGLNDSPIGEEAGPLLSDNVDFSNPSPVDSNADVYPTFDVQVPDTVLASAQKVTVRYLFAGGDKYKNDYRTDYALPISTFRIDGVSVVSKGATVVLAITGDLPPNITALIDNILFTPTIDSGGAFLNLTAPQSLQNAVPAPISAPAPGLKRAGGLNSATHNHAGKAKSRGAVPAFTDILVPSVPLSTSSGRALARGATPTTGEPSANTPSPSSYSVALLYTTKNVLLDGAENIVLYKPGSPAQLLSLVSILNDIKGVAAAPTASKPIAQQYPSVYFSLGAPPTSAGAAPSNAAPAGPQSPVAGIVNLNTISKSGTAVQP